MNTAEMISTALASTLQVIALADLQYDREENNDLRPLKGTDRTDPGAVNAAEALISAIEDEKGKKIEMIVAELGVSIPDFVACIASQAMGGGISHDAMEDFNFTARIQNSILTLEY